jgi:hypothetical protein
VKRQNNEAALPGRPATTITCADHSNADFEHEWGEVDAIPEPSPEPEQPVSEDPGEQPPRAAYRQTEEADHKSAAGTSA